MQSHTANFFCSDHRCLPTLKPAPIERTRIKKEPLKSREVQGERARRTANIKLNHIYRDGATKISASECSGTIRKLSMVPKGSARTLKSMVCFEMLFRNVPDLRKFNRINSVVLRPRSFGNSQWFLEVPAVPKVPSMMLCLLDGATPMRCANQEKTKYFCRFCR